MVALHPDEDGVGALDDVLPFLVLSLEYQIAAWAVHLVRHPSQYRAPRVSIAQSVGCSGGLAGVA
jgi:hypothetical protein